jgi:transcription antitermination factor NusG
LPDKIIITIKDHMNEGNEVVIRPQHLKKGDRVKINNGAFKDFFGIFERETKGPERVMVLLDTIYYKLEIDSCLLTKVS